RERRDLFEMPWAEDLVRVRVGNPLGDELAGDDVGGRATSLLPADVAEPRRQPFERRFEVEACVCRVGRERSGDVPQQIEVAELPRRVEAWAGGGEREMRQPAERQTRRPDALVESAADGVAPHA